MGMKPNRMAKPNRGELFLILITLVAALFAIGVVVLALLTVPR